MSRKKIIITGLGGDIAQAVTKSLDRNNFEIIGCDMDPVPYFSYFADRFYQLPAAANGPEFLDQLQKIVREEGAHFVLPLPEPELRFLNQHRNQFSGWGTKFLMQSEKVLDVFSDKLKTVDFLHAQAIVVPKTYVLRNFKDHDLSFPMIIKPRFSCGSRNNWLVRDQIDLNYLRQKDDGSFIAQEYIGDPQGEFTTGVFSDGKKTVSISFKRKLGFSGLSKEIVLFDDPALDTLAQRVAKSVSLQGSINIQSRLHQGNFVPFEINPRISSTVLFRKKFGFEDVSWWIDLLEGKSFQYCKEFSSGQGYRILTDLFVDLKSTRLTP